MRVTENQRRTMAFFMAYTEDNGRPPTLDEVAVFLGVSKQYVHQIVRALEKKGLMANGGGPRAWRVTL